MYHIIYKFNRCYDTGQNIFIYEYIIGFQGNQKYKLCISYKIIGYGLKSDAICEEGYTYAFMFRNNIMNSSDNHGLCDLNERFVRLIQEINYDWMILFMNSLSNSSTLAKLACNDKDLVHGVLGTHQCDVPKKVVQRNPKLKISGGYA